MKNKKYDSVPEMLDDMGEKEAAQEIKVHENCLKKIVLLLGKIEKLKADLKFKDRIMEFVLSPNDVEDCEQKLKDIQEGENIFCADSDAIPMDIVNDSLDNDISIVAAYERKCERLGTATWEAYQFISASLEVEYTEEYTLDMMDKLCAAIGLEKDES